MEKKPGITHFSDFYKTNEKKSGFNKEDFNDFFLPEDLEEEINESFEPDEEEEEEEVQESPKSSKKESPKSSKKESPEEEEEEEEEEEPKEEEKNENFYSLYKDKSENFSCDISVEGAAINETQVRLIVESDDWTLMFEGEVDKKGKCNIPIKKLGILNEGTTGKIRLEVIAEGSVFIPWEDDFKVRLSKKVSIKLNESKSTPKKSETKKPGVKVNFRK
jgi:acetyl/propionyl-CoA carboxylase alpha subunit